MPDNNSSSLSREEAERRLPVLRRNIQDWIRWYVHSQFSSPETRVKLPAGGPTEWGKIEFYMERFAAELYALVPDNMRREFKELEALVEIVEAPKVRSYSSEEEVPDAYWHVEGEVRRVIDRPFLRIKLGLTDSGILKLIDEGKLTVAAKFRHKEIYLREELEKLEAERNQEAQKKEADKARKPLMGWAKKTPDKP